MRKSTWSLLLIMQLTYVQAQLNFESTQTISNSAFANDIVSSDFDGDGLEDLLTSGRQNGNFLKLYFGNADGSFENPVDVLAGGSTDEIALADFDDNGTIDIATNLQYGNRVSIILNNGSGSFSNSTFLVADQPYDIISLDANNDNIPDLAVGHNSGRTIDVYTGNGDGTFTKSYSSDHNELVRALISGDLDNDGFVDIIGSAVNEYFVTPFFGNGDGTFTRGNNIRYSFSQGIISDMELADINNDNNLDLIAMGISITIHLGDGEGNFSQNQNIEISRNDDIGGIELIDFNTDGDIDLIYGNDESIGLLEGDGTGSFANEILLFAPDTREFTLIDFNQDGINDIATTGIVLLEGYSDNEGFKGSRFYEEGRSGGKSLVADFNNDQYIDFISSDNYNAELFVGQESGFFDQRVSLSIQGFSDFIAGDVNNDNFNDIILSDNDNIATVLINDQLTTPRFTNSQSFILGGTPLQLIASDLNDDSNFDLITYNDNNSVSILLGNGTSLNEKADIDLSSIPSANGISIGDLDQDGANDLFIKGDFSIIPGDNSGTFNLDQKIQLDLDESNTIYTHLEDITGDGDPDMIIITDDGTLTIYKAIEGFNFSSGITTFSFNINSFRDLTINDIDNDGLKDLVSLHTGVVDSIRVFLSRANGTIEPPFEFTSPSGGGNLLLLSDISNDGLNDIIQSRVVIHENLYLPSSEIEVLFDESALITGATIDFGRTNIGETSKEIILTISNPGVNFLEILGFEVSNNDYIIEGLEQNTISSGSDLSFSVVFNPSSKQEFKESLEIFTNDPNESVFEIILIGSGIGIPEIEISLLTPSDQIFEETEVTFKSSITNGGPNPSISWFINDTFQASSENFTTTSLMDSDIVKATLKSDDPLISTDSVVSNELIITILEQILSVDQSIDSGLTIYPNPVKNSLTVDIGNKKKIEVVEILDLSGKVVKTKRGTAHGGEKMEADVSSLTSGLYFVVVRFQNEVVKKKIVVE